MKAVFSIIVCCLLLGFSNQLNAQELSKEIAWAIKYSQTDYLDKWIEDADINSCLGVRKSKKYNYLAMSIKLNSMTSLK